MDSFINQIRNMIELSDLLSRQRFELEFDNDTAKARAYAIEYGTELTPPLPFIRLCEIDNESSWQKMIDELYGEVINGSVSIDEATSRIAQRIESDYRSSARDSGIDEEIVNSMYVAY